jgi:flavin-dependent dehydrogenase
VSLPAGRGYFIAGDAAAVVDPASSDGVIRALLSGRLAGHLAAQAILGEMPEAVAVTAYIAWVRDLYANRVSRLDALYSEAFPGWRERGSPRAMHHQRTISNT